MKPNTRKRAAEVNATANEVVAKKKNKKKEPQAMAANVNKATAMGKSRQNPSILPKKRQEMRLENFSRLVLMYKLNQK